MEQRGSQWQASCPVQMASGTCACQMTCCTRQGLQTTHARSMKATFIEYLYGLMNPHGDSDFKNGCHSCMSSTRKASSKPASGAQPEERAHLPGVHLKESTGSAK